MASISERQRSPHNFSFPSSSRIGIRIKTTSSIDTSSLRPKSAGDDLKEGAKEVESPQRKKQPWNLRGKKSTPDAANSIRNSPALVSPSAEHQVKSLRPRSLGPAAHEERKEKKEKVKFSMALSQEEINADFLEITDSKPPRRPRKRPRIVRKALNSTFPGLSLSEIIAEIPEPNQR